MLALVRIVLVGAPTIACLLGAIYLVGWLCDRYLNRPEREVRGRRLMRIADAIGSGIAHGIFYAAMSIGSLFLLLYLGLSVLGTSAFVWLGARALATVLIAAWLVNLAIGWFWNLIGII